MKFTEKMLQDYSAPLSKTEDEKCKNVIGMIRDALKGLGFSDGGRSISPLFEDTYAYNLELNTPDYDKKVKILIQGSYANNTNVKGKSDVDVAVILESTFRVKYRSDSSSYPQHDADYGFGTSTYTVKQFKDDVEVCLKKKFGSDYVERHNKSIKIIGNSYHNQADTVPCQRYKDYSGDFRKDSSNYIGGIAVYPDNGGMIINYPEQHIHNGAIKNTTTGHRYKKQVRIMKKMRYLMSDYRYQEAEKVSSFGLESLLWNIPDEVYERYSLLGFNFDEVLNYLGNHDISNYKEANGIKPLFERQIDKQNYISFLIALRRFFEYDYE